MRRCFPILLFLLSSSGICAQQSASYRLEERVLNAGGHPAAGVSPGSASYRISIGSLGEGVLGATLSSGSFQLAGGFVSPYPPPGEVQGLLLPGPSTLAWTPERSAGTYSVYRDSLATLPSLVYGACDQQGIALTTAAAGPDPPARAGYFYLVTAENRLGEEGSKGFRTGGAERTGSACP